MILGTFGSPLGRQRVADFGDGWIPIGVFQGAKLREDIADLGERLRKNGRDPQSVSISMFDIYETSPDDLTRFRDLGVIARAISRCPTEDSDTVLRWLDSYAETLQTQLAKAAGRKPSGRHLAVGIRPRLSAGAPVASLKQHGPYWLDHSCWRPMRYAPARIQSAARSPSMMQVRLVLARTIFGITEASTTRSPSTPCTRKY